MAEEAPVPGRGPLRVPTLWISGPVGVGKTTVGYEVSTLLDRDGVHHTFVEYDVLAQTYPAPPGDRFNTRLSLRILVDLWRHASAAGLGTSCWPGSSRPPRGWPPCGRRCPTSMCSSC